MNIYLHFKCTEFPQVAIQRVTVGLIVFAIGIFGEFYEEFSAKRNSAWENLYFVWMGSSLSFYIPNVKPTMISCKKAPPLERPELSFSHGTSSVT